jgi:hypothetical protein
MYNILFGRRKKFQVNNADVTYKVHYLGNVMTSLVKGGYHHGSNYSNSGNGNNSTLSNSNYVNTSQYENGNFLHSRIEDGKLTIKSNYSAEKYRSDAYESYHQIELDSNKITDQYLLDEFSDENSESSEIYQINSMSSNVLRGSNNSYATMCNVDRPVQILWENHIKNNGHAGLKMKLTLTQGGLKVDTKDHGVTEYYGHRIHFIQAHPLHPKLFVWVYQHVGKNLKSEIRCHAALCQRTRDARSIAALLDDKLQRTFLEYKREKRRQQNSRLCNTKNHNVLVGQVGTRKRSFRITRNYKPPVQHGMCSAPKLDDVLEEEEEESDEIDSKEIYQKSIKSFISLKVKSNELKSNKKDENNYNLKEKEINMEQETIIQNSRKIFDQLSDVIHYEDDEDRHNSKYVDGENDIINEDADEEDEENGDHDDDDDDDDDDEIEEYSENLSSPDEDSDHYIQKSHQNRECLKSKEEQNQVKQLIQPNSSIYDQKSSTNNRMYGTSGSDLITLPTSDYFETHTELDYELDQTTISSLNSQQYDNRPSTQQLDLTSSSPSSSSSSTPSYQLYNDDLMITQTTKLTSSSSTFNSNSSSSSKKKIFLSQSKQTGSTKNDSCYNTCSNFSCNSRIESPNSNKNAIVNSSGDSGIDEANSLKLFKQKRNGINLDAMIEKSVENEQKFYTEVSYDFLSDLSKLPNVTDKKDLYNDQFLNPPFPLVYKSKSKLTHSNSFNKNTNSLKQAQPVTNPAQLHSAYYTPFSRSQISRSFSAFTSRFKANSSSLKSDKAEHKTKEGQSNSGTIIQLVDAAKLLNLSSSKSEIQTRSLQAPIAEPTYSKSNINDIELNKILESPTTPLSSPALSTFSNSSSSSTSSDIKLQAKAFNSSIKTIVPNCKSIIAL